MQLRIKRIFKYSAGLTGVFSVLLVVVFFNATPNSDLKVSFFDIGQGDAALIRTPYKQDILIDGGPGKYVIEKIGRSLPFFDREIDLIIITHPHSDHYQGIFEVLKNYKIKKVLVTDIETADQTYLSLLKEIKNKNIILEYVNQPMNISFGENLTLEILFPNQPLISKSQEDKDLNNTSIIARLVFKETEVFFTGDLEEAAEQYLINKQIPIQADILKVGHHGSSTSTSEEFLQAVDPEVAIISVGKNNKYGHPSERVIRRLQRFGAETYRTDRDGDVMILTDGEDLEVVSSK